MSYFFVHDTMGSRGKQQFPNDDPAERKNPPMISFFIHIRQILRRCSKDEITVYAAQASFFIVTAFFPFIMLLLTLIQCLPDVDKSDLLSALMRIMPPMLHALVTSIVDDLYVKSPGTILSVAALIALWSASKGMLGIERGLNRIYGDYKHRNYILQRLLCAIYTLIFMLVCVMSMVLLIFGKNIEQMFFRYFPILAPTASYVIHLRSLFAFAVFLLTFVGLYTIVPSKKQRPRQQLFGAVFTAVGWLVFSYAFSIYFTHFSNFSYMYGSLTAVVLLMLWLYICICILFIGAELNREFSILPIHADVE